MNLRTATKLTLGMLMISSITGAYASDPLPPGRLHTDVPAGVTDFTIPRARKAFIVCDSSSQLTLFYVRFRSTPNAGYDDLFLRRFTVNGAARGSEVAVTSTYYAFPNHIALSQSGGCIVAWRDYPNVVIAQYSSSDILMYPPMVNFPTGYQDNVQNIEPHAVIRDGGGCVVAWDYSNSPSNSYHSLFRLYDSNGQPVGSETIFTPERCAGASVAALPNGAFAVSWSNGQESHLYSQHYSKEGIASGPATIVDSTGSAAYIYRSTGLVADNAGNTAIAWPMAYPGSSNPNIYLQRLDSSGTRIGPSVTVNDDQSGASHGEPAIAMAQTGELVLVWRDFRNPNGGCDIYGQRYDRSGKRLGGNFLIARRVLDDWFYGAPTVAANTDIIACAWRDEALDTHVTSFPWTQQLVASVDDAIADALPHEFVLSQNYPNPFNPSTVIRFKVPSGADMKIHLAVYDMLGREVAVLVDGTKQPGEYTQQFDGSGLANGIYFYRLTAGSYMALRKMALLR